MQSFELPDFYVPWPARLNPNRDMARIHSKAWAQEMGILGSHQDEGSFQIWDEDRFDKHDYALFCSYIHPETPSYELNLMTDWNVWAFYVDDYFLQVYKKQKDHVGGKQYLDRIPLFMPVDLEPMPAPTNPTERGLADLWIRTAPSKSKVWRSRIIESTKSLLEESLLELDNMIKQRLANPIEYIEMRRRVGGALWSADLVEHAVFVEIPERIAASRPMQVLKNTFADAVHLRNDIFSYEREVIKEGELTNGVLVIEHFLGVDTQRAVHLVNDLLTSRLQQFEHTAVTELEPLFEEYHLDPGERKSVLTYIRGLQDWQSGAHEWHIQTGRYLNPSSSPSSTIEHFVPGSMGFGRSASRITPDRLGLNRFRNYMHIPYQKVGPTQLPEFYMPFRAQVNPNVDTARQHSRLWAHKMGMLNAIPGYPGVFIMDEHSLDAADMAFFSACAHPNVAAEQLKLDACWVIWTAYADDFFTEVYGHTHDMAGAKIFRARLAEFMPLDGKSSISIPLNPVERGLADLWTRTTEGLPLSERCSSRRIINGMVESWLWELSNRVQNRIPDVIDYIEMRRKTSGSDFILILPRSEYGQNVPPEIPCTRIMQELNNAAIDYVCITNDILSYQKEIEFEGDFHNCVLVIQNFLHCDRAQAVEIANNLLTARMKQFEHITTTELPALFDSFRLDSSARDQLLGYVEELKYFMSGSLQWHITTGRYHETEIRRSSRPLIGTLTGLGTTAVHILEMVAPGRSTALSPPRSEGMAKEVKTFAISHLEPPFARKKDEVPKT